MASRHHQHQAVLSHHAQQSPNGNELHQLHHQGTIQHMKEQLQHGHLVQSAEHKLAHEAHMVKDEMNVLLHGHHMEGEQLERSPSRIHTAFQTEHSAHYHRTFDWIQVEDQMETSRDISDQECVDEYGCPLRILHDHLKHEISEEASFKTLPFAILLVVLFAAMYIRHDQARYCRNMEDGITFDIEENANFAFSDPYYMGHKNIYDVNSFPDFYSWLRLGAMAILLPSGWPVSEGQADIASENMTHYFNRIHGYYLNYNKVIGGVRLRQEVAPPAPCPDDDLVPMYGKGCFPPEGVTKLNINLEPELYDVETNIPNFDESKTVWLMLNSQTESERLDKVTQMELGNWIEEGTVRISVDFLVYSGHFKMLTWSCANFFFTRSGHIWKAIVHESVHMDPYDSWVVYILDTVFILQLSHILLSELKEIIMDIKNLCKDGLLGFFTEYFNFWNLIDWASIIQGFVIVFAGAMVFVGTTNLKSQLLGLSEEESVDYVTELEALLRDFDSLARLVHKFRYIAALYPIIIVLRLFKAFSSQPRLALVTQTLSAASIDIAHFMIVFCAVFMTYAVMGVALFGREVVDFCTFSRAVGTCFLVLMGDFDVNEMRSIGRMLAGIWFWSFMVLILLIMLNMLLAIIMDTYTDTKQKISGSETLWFQAYDMYRRRQQRIQGARVSIHFACKCLDPHMKEDPDQIIGVPHFMAMVPQLKQTQARRLMVNAVQAFRMSNEDPLSIAEAMSVIALVHAELELMHEAIEFEKGKSTASSPAKAKASPVLPVVADRSFQELKELKEESQVNDLSEAYYKQQLEASAARIQAAYRGKQTRKQIQLDIGSDLCWNGGGNRQGNGASVQEPSMPSQSSVDALGCRGYGSVSSVTILGRAQALRQGGVLPQHRQNTLGLVSADPAPSLAEAQQASVLIDAARRRAVEQHWRTSPERCKAFCTTMGLIAQISDDPVFSCAGIARAARKWDTGRVRAVQLEQKLGPASFQICPCVTEQRPPALPA